MKLLVLVGDGMADFPLDTLGGRTPLDVAATPAMDRAAHSGILGLFSPIPDGFPPGSDIGNLSLFGYEPGAAFTGRAPLEAASKGIPVGPDEVAFRCNLVTLRDGCMASFTAGHISTGEAAELIRAIDAGLAGRGVTFYPGVSYRHLAIFAKADGLPETACTPPHDISDRPYAPHLPSGPSATLLTELIERSHEVLKGHPINRARESAGQPPATHIWLWGQGRAPRIETYPERFGRAGVVVSAVDLVKGIGVCAGLTPLSVPGATGYLDTNYAGKVSAALDGLDQEGFAYLHVEAPDETSHEGDAALKIRAIEDFDAHVVAPCLARAAEDPSIRILIAPDHVTSIASKTHATGAVPFILCGAGVVPNGASCYTERAAAAMGLHISPGSALTPLAITAARLDAAALQQPVPR